MHSGGRPAPPAHDVLVTAIAVDVRTLDVDCIGDSRNRPKHNLLSGGSPTVGDEDTAIGSEERQRRRRFAHPPPGGDMIARFADTEAAGRRRQYTCGVVKG